jgi:hypothetical protein
VLAHVAAPISHFISLEVGNLVHVFIRFGFVAAVRCRTRVAAMRIEVVVDVAVEVGRAVKPRAGANEYTACKPFRAVIAVWRAIVRGVIVVAVRAIGGDSDVNGDLSVRRGSGYAEAGYRNSSQSKSSKSVHRFLLVDICPGRVLRSGNAVRC